MSTRHLHGRPAQKPHDSTPWCLRPPLARGTAPAGRAAEPVRARARPCARTRCLCDREVPRRVGCVSRPPFPKIRSPQERATSPVDMNATYSLGCERQTLQHPSGGAIGSEFSVTLRRALGFKFNGVEPSFGTNCDSSLDDVYPGALV